MSTGGSYSGERPPSVDVDYSADPASGSFFSTEFKKHEDLKQMLDSNKDGLKLEAMKRIIGMVAKGRDASELFPAVVKNVVSANLEVKKLVYVYLVRYAEEQQDLALLSISTFQRALKDPNQLIRACALRVLSSIRVPVIVPIMMLAIKDAVTDMSPYVRKTAAHAIPKLYSLDPEQKEELIQVLEKLLSDKTTLVVGSAVMAFEEVCPERIDLIHKNYRKLCNLLVDVEEWGQVVIINMLTRYARTQFVDPNVGEPVEEKEKPFYEDDEEEEEEEETTAQQENRRSKAMDPDHRLLLRNTKPLLQSRNAAVVLAVAQLYQHIAPRSEVSQVARALVRLLRSHREVQAVVLTNIASMSTRRKGMFKPYLKSFFVRSCDPTHIKALKLEVLTNLATDTNISVILREFQTYIGSSDKEFVAATIQAIGRCASNIKEVTDTCLSGLVCLLSNRDESVVGESVVVIRKLLQSETVGHRDIISHMARLMDNIKIPMARASILWLLGEYCDKVPKIAPDVLRKMAKTFIVEDDIVKLQILTLATKLFLTNPKQTRLLCQYVYNLAKYDMNYDIRDRARLTRAIVFPSQGHEDNKLTKQAKKIFLATKPPPVQQSSFKDRDQFQLSTLSHLINARASGYQDLPMFPEAAPDPSVRNVEIPVAFTPESHKPVHQKRSKAQKMKSFYSDEESSPDEESEESSSGSESDSDDDDDETTDSDSEESSSDESEAESEDEEEEKLRAKKRGGGGGGGKLQRNKESEDSTGSEDSDSSSSSSESSSSESSSKEEEDEESDDSLEKTMKGKAAKTKKPSKSTPPPAGGNRSNLDLLLDLDDSPPAMDTPLLTPSLGGLLTPTPSAQAAQVLPPGASIQPAIAKFIPTVTFELLNRISSGGLAVSARFTRSPHLYSPRMTSVELTFTNSGSEEIREIAVGKQKLAPGMSLHEFASVALISPDTTLHGTLGVDFNDTTQPALFDLVAGGRTFNISITPPVGELLMPLAMNEQDFNLNQGKLRGMNELSGTLKLPSTLTKPKDLIAKTYETANLLQVQSTDDKLLKFGGQTSSGKVLVLLSLSVPEDNQESNLTINCEKMVISSMLLKEFQSSFARE